MTEGTSPSPAAPPALRPRPSGAVNTALLAIVLMVLTGGLLVPFGRLFVMAVLGLFETMVLLPLGVDFPAIAPFVLANLVILATAFAAGRRTGAILAFRSVEQQLGSHRLLYALIALSGIAGVATFAAVNPWATPASLSLPLQAAYAIFGYLLYLPVLFAGPSYGARRYLHSHPYCPTCWVWLEPETAAGSFLLTDVPRVTSALSSNDLAALRDLPLADPDLPRAGCSLQWSSCPSCRTYALVDCVPGDPASPAILTTALHGPSVDALRSLISHRRALADPRPRAPEPSARPRLS
ncbi:MAG TPA: hypothetical protein VFN74_14590 [Chloroflexota bacterium]|nr:hypothetical protein [Chloroflexota bacterium]